MNTNEVEKLIEKYLDGLTTPDEERRLSAAVGRRDAPRHWQTVAVMLGEMARAEAVYEQRVAEHRLLRRRRYVGWAVAASLAVVSLAGLLYNSSRSNQSQADVAIAYVDGREITDHSQVLALAEDAVCDIFDTASEEDGALSGVFEIDE